MLPEPRLHLLNRMKERLIWQAPPPRQTVISAEARQNGDGNMSWQKRAVPSIEAGFALLKDVIAETWEQADADALGERYLPDPRLLVEGDRRLNGEFQEP